jgi:hypothetical protein|tara:strand:- start:8692 stop:9555 length:864 start_codon:yes stop_codon:yes gene_type:complete
LKQSPKWLSDDPDDYLHPQHLAPAHFIPPDWQDDYGRWRHCYLPGVREEVAGCFTAINCALFIDMIKPLVDLAARLVPDEVKSQVAPNNPADWTMLPEPQIRRIWRNERTLFSNAFLLLTCLQIAVFIKAGKVSGLTLSAEHEVEGLDQQSMDQIEAKLRELDIEHNQTLTHGLSLHLSVFETALPRPELWTRIADDPALLLSYKRTTNQPLAQVAKMFEGLKKGKLVSLLTAWHITKWLRDTLPDEPPVSWCYCHKQSPRRAAVEKESVPYCGRETVFGTIPTLGP